MIQVSKEHYVRKNYMTPDRWTSFGYQIRAAQSVRPDSVLEVGLGNGIVRDTLQKFGYRITTVDIDPELKPDVVASVTALPFPENSFDLVMACEVLEHLPWSDFSAALGELRRVTKKYILLTLPHAGYVFSVSFKFPLLPYCSWIFKIPHFWKTHVFNGEHYWEMGKRGYPVRRIKRELRHNGFRIRWSKIHADDPGHYFFLLEKV